MAWLLRLRQHSCFWEFLVLSMRACSLREETLALLTELIVADWRLVVEWICLRVHCSSCFVLAVRLVPMVGGDAQGVKRT